VFVLDLSSEAGTRSLSWNRFGFGFCVLGKGRERERERERERVVESSREFLRQREMKDEGGDFGMKIKIGVCVMQKKVKCGSEVPFFLLSIVFVFCFSYSIINMKQSL